MKKLLSDKKVSIFCHLLLALAVLPFVIMYDKNETLMFINGHNSKEADLVMYHITRLPELAMIVFVIALAFLTERRIFLAVAIAMTLCGLSILLFKNVIFPDFNRPFHWLNSQNISFNKVEGIRLHTNGSFPSGHSMAAFCSLALAGFISKRGSIQFLLFLCACVSAYSRVYVAQHYLRDVYTGALVGFTIALLVYTFFESRFKTPYWQQAFFSRKS